MILDKVGKVSTVRFINSAELGAATAGYKWRVLAVVLTAADNTTCTFRSHGAIISGEIRVLADSSVVLPFSPVGWCDTASGDDLSIDDAGGTITGHVVLQLFRED